MRRIVAMSLDMLLIMSYAVLVFLINKLFVGTRESISEMIANILGLVTVIIPTCIYYIVMEKRMGASLGKRIMHIHVKMLDRSQLRLKNTMIRTLIFVLPWISGHMFVFRGFYSEWQASNIFIILGFITYSMLIINYGFMLFRKDHRGLHEILSATYTE